ncbi:MAG: serine hydrolase [Bacillota bacterium]
MTRKVLFLTALLLCGTLLSGQVYSTWALAELGAPAATLDLQEASGQGLPLESTLLQVGSLSAIVKGQPYSLDAVPYIDPGASRVMAPFQLLADGAGLEWDWNGDSRLITLQKDGRTLYLGLGFHQALMDGEWLPLDCPCELSPSGLPFVPLRFVVEAFGGEISYDGSTKAIAISHWAADQNTDPEVKAASKSAKAVARTEIWKVIASGTASSAGVAIMDQGKTVYSEGIAMADWEAGIPADSDTVFNIGSVSKLFAATSIMLLVDEGKVVLDDPVTKYLPEFVMADERYQDITVRMLLNHSSGLPGSTFWGNLGTAYNEDVYQELLQSLALSTLKHRPGELPIYCNDGLTLAEMIVARVSGLDYGDFLTQRIFAPLALSHAGLGVGRLSGGKTPARAYDPDGRALPLEVLSLLGSGGISATPEDLCRFADSFSDPPSLLQSASQLEMLRRQPTELQGKLRADTFPYGLGWDYADVTPFTADLRLYGKSGGTAHYSSMLYTVPSYRISVAVIACGAGSNSQAIAYEVLSAYLQEKGLVSAGEEAVLPEATAEPVPSEQKNFEGHYLYGGSVVRLQLDAQEGTLTMFADHGGAAVPVFSALYSDGMFHDGKSTYYLTSTDGSDYLVGRNPVFKYDMIVAEKLLLPVVHLQLSISMEGRLWLRRGIKPTEGIELLLPYYIVDSGPISDLPGYVDFMGPKVVVAPDFAGMPAKGMRDLEELRLVDREGSIWLWLSGAYYMPAEACPQLGLGLTGVVIGQETGDEWLQLEADAMLGFDLPPGSRALVLGETGVLYDSLMDHGHVFAPAGSFIHLAGNPGDLLQVTATLK